MNRSTGKQLGIWKTEANRREFFEEVARDLNFNPLDVTEWYHVSSRFVRDRKVSSIRFLLLVLTFP
jgi:hypothetical protein